MKSDRILQTVIIMVIIATAASCRSTRGTQDRYPQPGYPDRGPYPEYPSYPPGRYPDYPVYHETHPDRLPPGQAKKIYGGKSAKPYAPGQRKKYGYRDYNAYPVYTQKGRIYPLIIIHTRNMTLYRTPGGQLRYVHPDGVIYYKGFDQRYYLDEQFIPYASYNRHEYSEWQKKGTRHSKMKDVFRN